MWAKKKFNRFDTSFRNCSWNLENELKLSVRRGLASVAAADNESDTKNIDDAAILGQLENLSIDEMTSDDISKDYRAHFREHIYTLKDIVYTTKWWNAICCNSHLFKDKVIVLTVEIVLAFFLLTINFTCIRILLNRLYLM